MSSVHLFNYDIPETRVFSARRNRTYSRPVTPNPSDELWAAGAVRITDSCWLIHEGAIPYDLVRRFRTNGVKWESAPFDPSAGESLARMALTNIRKEVAELVRGAEETAAREANRLAIAEGSGELTPGSKAATAAHKRYRSQLAATIRRHKKRLERVQFAAARFNLDTGVTAVLDARTMLDGVKAGMEARADAFAKAHSVIVKAKGKGDAMAVAIERNDVFGPVAADYLDELETPEATTAAANLRRAFDHDF